MKMKSLITLIVFCYTGTLFCQIFNGDIFYIQDGAVVKSEGFIVNDDLIKNYGKVITDEYFSNLDTVLGSGDFYIAEDWENWAYQSIDSSSVFFDGTSQAIRGNSSEFWNIESISPTLLSQETKVIINNSLTLNQTEYSTNNDTLLITNSDPSSIIAQISPNSDGFISTDQNGVLLRNTDAYIQYTTPLGSNDGTSRIRPLITSSIETGYLGMKFLNYPPTDIFNKENKIKLLNNAYHHEVSSQNNLSVNILGEVLDGQYDFISPYEGIWKNNDDATISNINSFVAYQNNIDFEDSTFLKKIALVKKKRCWDDILIPEFISPNNDGFNDEWDVITIDGCTADVKIFNRYGNIIFEEKNYNGDFRGKSNLDQAILSSSSQNLPSGTYYYILKMDGDSKSGFIQLQIDK